jgi:ribosomal protein S18 acetylase RimI-like enzyme
MIDELSIRDADYDCPRDREAIVELLDMYALEDSGTGDPLPPDVQRNLVAGLREHPMSRVLLACVDGRAVGIAVCFVGFSTFAAKRLVNLHDFAVRPEFRRQGIGRRLMQQVEKWARELDCCKITLEVRHDNQAAQRLYHSYGFSDPGIATHFWSKPLDSQR